MLRLLFGLRLAFRRIVLLRLAGALLRVVFRRLLDPGFLLAFVPDFRLFARAAFRFRVVLRFRVALLRDGLRCTRRRRRPRTVLRERDMRLVLRFGVTLLIASQNLQ